MKIHDPVGSFLSKIEKPTVFYEENDIILCEDHDYVKYDLYPYRTKLVSIVSFKMQSKCSVCNKELSNPSKEEWKDWIFEVGAGHVLHLGFFEDYNEYNKMFTIKEELCLEGSIFISTTVTAPIAHFQPYTRKDSPLWKSHLKSMREEDECPF